MANLAKVRQLLQAIYGIAAHLTDDEISDIAKVLLRATTRLEKNARGKG